MKRSKIIALVLAALLIAVPLVFLNTSVGKAFTVRYRGYTEIADRVYLDRECSLEDYEALFQLIADSQVRVNEFWGELGSSPIFVFSDSRERLRDAGLSVNSASATTFVLNGARTYIGVYLPAVENDILAHEICHAELHERIYKGKFTPSQLIPVWFDEGLALQVDYREKYNDEAWNRLLAADESVKDWSELVTPAQFFAGDMDERVKNYIASRHEVKQWYEEHGHEALLELIQGVNSGKSFDQLYDPE